MSRTLPLDPRSPRGSSPLSTPSIPFSGLLPEVRSQISCLVPTDAWCLASGGKYGETFGAWHPWQRERSRTWTRAVPALAWTDGRGGARPGFVRAEPSLGNYDAGCAAWQPRRRGGGAGANVTELSSRPAHPSYSATPPGPQPPRGLRRKVPPGRC